MAGRSASFKKILEDKDWDELMTRTRSSSRPLHPDKASAALRKIYADPTVPVNLIRSLLQTLKVHSSPETGAPYKLADFVKHESQPCRLDIFCHDVCVNAPATVLKEFLQVLPGSYRTHRGRNSHVEHWWPSMGVARRMIDIIWHRGLKGLDDPKHLLAVSNEQELKAQSKVHEIWKKTELILMAATGRNIDKPSEGGKTWLVIHAAAEVNVSTVVVWFGLKLFPDQVRTRDHRGRFPLHYAVMDDRQTHVLVPEEIEAACPHQSLVYYLHRAYPEAAKAVDSQNKLPLTIALESQKWWPQASVEKTSGDPDDRHGEAEALSLASLKNLLKAAPEALTTRDINTHMWPFLRAAVEGAPIDTIYFLLRANPSPIQHRQRETTQNILRNRLLEVEEENRSLKEQLKLEMAKTKRLQDELDRLRGREGASEEDTHVTEDHSNQNLKKRPRTAHS